MLIQFNFKNFLSFRDDVTLDLSATKISEFNNRVVSVGGERVLPVAAIYGANASGKSNVYNAFVYMSKYVAFSLHYGDDPKEFENNKPMPFAFDNESENIESSFEVYFTIPGDQKEKCYNYGFCIGNEGVTEEWLNYKAKSAREYKSIFYRSVEDNELDLSGLPKSTRENIAIALDKQVLIVSLGAKLKVEKCKMIREWFINNEFTDFGNEVTSFIMHRNMPDDFEDKAVQKKVIEYFSTFDESIKGFELEKLPPEEEGKNIKYKISSIHKKMDSDESVLLPFNLESAGTRKMFALYPELQEVLRLGSILFVDELNARLHPLLVRNLILLFLNPEINVNHAQLIFTTHDVWQLSNLLLRRDEIWFTEKDENGVSSLYSLADFVDEDGTKIRKEESFEKNYILGKYGAIPTLKTIDMILEK